MHGAFHNNGPVVDFRNFHLEKAHKQLRIGAGKNDLRAFGNGQNLDDNCADTFALFVGFGSGLLTERKQRFGFSDIHDDIRTLESLRDSVDHFADLLRILVVDILSFGFPHLLKNYLLRCLSRDASQNVRGFGYLDRVVDFQRVVDFLRIAQRNFQAWILHGFDNAPDRKDFNHACFGIESRVDVFVGFVKFPGSGHHRIFQCADDDLGIDVFFFANLFDRLSNDVRHISGPLRPHA